jgi:hypothetical protein
MFQQNQTVGKSYKVFCATCGRLTNHVVKTSLDDHGHNEDADIHWEDHYQVIQCLGCETISFCHLEQNSEYSHQIGVDEWDDGDVYHLYPSRSEKIRKLKSYPYAPPVLRRIYRETIESFNGESLTLCAGGIRAIIEGLCAANSILDGQVTVAGPSGTSTIQRKNNLQGKISGLAERRLLTQAHADILHEHRFLGNEALHELALPSPGDLGLAIDIVEHIIDALYEVPAKGEEMRANRLRRANAQAARRAAP